VRALIEQLSAWDGEGVDIGAALRWPPLTIVFALASASWVKWPLFAAVGALGDASRRRLVPAVALRALSAAALAGLAVSAVKAFADRPRPPLADPGLATVGTLPDSSSFPSGHAATAFAAAVAVGIAFPRLRAPLLALAAVVALSRVYLGVHYPSDVIAGSLLGVSIGLTTCWLWALARRSPRALGPSLAALGTSFARLRRSQA
jgi:membrane-associated phospholipid phosphatase